METLKKNHTEIERKALRFKNDIKTVLGNEYYTKIHICDDTKIIKSTKVNTDAVLDNKRLHGIIALVGKHNFNNIEIKRSGAGLRIQFSI
ncbi:MAG TPA: hypothetical protein DHV22_16925 [Xanthomarina gelatinilytica]|uniref:Uncharacterized protein n=1 Tax=Xanthomarina gelatinilytica TaxID=1137281 RepID=A0A3D6BVV4_9FLAO|nr:hypothetical protein [Xanthomarina gelatinilytica]